MVGFRNLMKPRRERKERKEVQNYRQKGLLKKVQDSREKGGNLST
jgi:hypothetical protein